MKTAILPGRVLKRSYFVIGLMVLILQPGSAAAQIIPADRRTDWTVAGHPGGIPNRTSIFINVRMTEIPRYKCYGDGVTDDTTALFNAINDCGYVDQNKVIYMPAGRYRITRPLFFGPQIKWTLRGEVINGANATTIVCDFPSSSVAFTCGGSDYPRPHSADIVDIRSGYTKGSTHIVLAGTNIVNGSTSFAPAVGGIVAIDQLNDGYMVTPVGAQGIGQTRTGTTFDLHREGLRNLCQIVKITAINNHTNITFWPPLNWAFDASLSPQLTVLNPTLTTKEIGFEDLVITNKANVHSFFVLYQADGCWFRNVEIQGAVNATMVVFISLGLEIKQCYFGPERSDAATSASCPIIQVSSNFKIEDCIFVGTQGQLEINSSSQGGVVAYNYFARPKSPNNWIVAAISANHSAHPMMNLYEGNVANGYFQTDYYWGSSSHATFFRNQIIGEDVTNGKTINLKCFALDRNSLSNNIVGNVLGSANVSWTGYEASTSTPYPYENSFIYRLGYPMIGNNGYSSNTNAPDGYDPRVRATLLRHGNYDYATRSTIWDSNISDRILPNSLYLTVKPNWWGTNRWPAIGSDMSPLATEIPAQTRFRRPLTVKPPAPTGLQVNPVIPP